MSLTPDLAEWIIKTVGSHGCPPEYGVQFFTAGLDEYLSPLETEYLSGAIKDGASSFKMVIGYYGGGKTHFLYNLRDLAWKHNFAVSYVVLKPEETPFHKLELVYRAIALGLMYPMSAEELRSGTEKGIENFIRVWFAQKSAEYEGQGMQGMELKDALTAYADSIRGLESTSFVRAVRHSFLSLAERRQDDFENIVQWLKVEGFQRTVHSRYGIFEKIDKSRAFPMIRTLLQWVRYIGYSGLVILLDEAEQVPSYSGRQKQSILSNLRELIDACGHASFQGAMVFYAVPDETFLEGRALIYEALRQRVATVFEVANPSGVKIHLDQLSFEPSQLLQQIGEKLWSIFARAYDVSLDPQKLSHALQNLADVCYERRFADIGYKRLFVQKAVRAFYQLRENPNLEIDRAWAEAIL